jgi:predicted small lipoprotein YifL
MRRLCVLILLAFLAGACGQKGPLYLPKDDDSNNNKNKKHEPRKTEEGTIEQ